MKFKVGDEIKYIGNELNSIFFGEQENQVITKISGVQIWLSPHNDWTHRDWLTGNNRSKIQFEKVNEMNEQELKVKDVSTEILKKIIEQREDNEKEVSMEEEGFCYEHLVKVMTNSQFEEYSGALSWDEDKDDLILEFGVDREEAKDFFKAVRKVEEGE